MTTLQVARPSVNQKTPFYYGGIFFLAIKAMTFTIHEIRIGEYRLDFLSGYGI